SNGWLFGLDLCPRLRNLRNRILYVPKGLRVPTNLTSVVSHNVSIPAIQRRATGVIQ
ncbi:MAG: transposase, partial [Gammaproteobacteria bacterium]|nr:transposase [Gammaproteobacteria bacterium]